MFWCCPEHAYSINSSSLECGLDLPTCILVHLSSEYGANLYSGVDCINTVQVLSAQPGRRDEGACVELGATGRQHALCCFLVCCWVYPLSPSRLLAVRARQHMACGCFFFNSWRCSVARTHSSSTASNSSSAAAGACEVGGSHLCCTHSLCLLFGNKDVISWGGFLACALVSFVIPRQCTSTPAVVLWACATAIRERTNSFPSYRQGHFVSRVAQSRGHTSHSLSQGRN